MEASEHYFYVLLCGDGSLYAGYTNALERRIKMHNDGKGAKYTRGRGPVQLVYSRLFDDKSGAMKAEYEFKQWTRKKKDDFLLRETGGLYATTEKL